MGDSPPEALEGASEVPTDAMGARAGRILYCTDSYLPQINGVSIVTAQTLTGLQRLGWQCGVIAPAYPRRVTTGSSPAPAGPAVPVHAIPSVAWPPYPDLRLAWPARHAIRRWIRRFRPDVVHCTTEFVIGRLALSVARELGIPCCTTYHTNFGQYADAYGVSWLRRPVEQWISRVHRLADRTYTPSTVARAELERMGVQRTEVWGRGIDTDLFHPGHRSQALRVRLDIERAFTFLYVGRLAPEKNVALLLAAFDEVQRQRPPGSVRLLIVGHGPAEAALRRQAGAHVTFLGAQDRTTQLPTLYASTDAFVFASTTETLGLVLLEAMASGLPVIAVAAGGVRDHVRDDDTGLCFEGGDVAGCARAMEQCVNDPATRHRLAAAGRRWAETHAWDLEMERLDASYRELLSARAAP